MKRDGQESFRESGRETQIAAAGEQSSYRGGATGGATGLQHASLARLKTPPAPPPQTETLDRKGHDMGREIRGSHTHTHTETRTEDSKIHGGGVHGTPV